MADVLREEGFNVAELADPQHEAIRAEVSRFEPDVVLLDGWDQMGYGRARSSTTTLRRAS